MKILKVVLITSISGLVLTGCSGSSNSEQPATLNVDENKKEVTVQEESKVESAQVTNTNENTQENKQEDKKEFKVSEHLEEIKAQVTNFNSFKVGDPNHFENIKSALGKLHVKVDDNIKTPFTIYPDRNRMVFSGIIIDKKVTVEDKIVTFDYTIRHAVSAVTTKKPTEVGKNVMDKLKDNKYETLNKQVKYVLTINESDTEATLELKSDKWW